MEHAFWHQRWQNKEIGFHLNEPNPLLLAHVSRLALAEGSHLLLPLCGKTRDMAWLLAQGYRVTGVELSRVAIEQLFDELGVEPEVTRQGAMAHFRADALEIFVGDFFALQPEQLERVDAVYDRAALIALPRVMRDRYVTHLRQLSHDARQLLISLHYDQTQMAGPPFSVDADEVQQHYGGPFALGMLADEPIPGGLKGKCEAHEQVWLLEPVKAGTHHA